MTVRGVFLQLLAEGPRHGYQLKVDFEGRTGGVWSLNAGQVYTTLDRLVRDGVVEASGDGEAGQRIYQITATGRSELAGWLTASPADGSPPRDELIMKVVVALGGSPGEAQQVIDDQRAALLGALQAGRRRQRSRSGSDDAVTHLAHDALLSRVEADVAWLDRCEEMLRQAGPDGRNRG